MATQPNKSFADWYQLIAVRPSPELIPKRWSAVEAVAKADSRALLLEMVRLVRGNAPAEGTIRASITEVARKLDASFSSRDSDAELRLLAGAAIVEILRTPSDRADLVALALVASAFPAGTGDQMLNEFLPYARQYLSNQALRMRETSDRSSVATKDTLEKLFELFVKAVPDPTGQAKEFVTALASAVDGATKQVTSQLEALREESNMFWWVFSGTSRDLERPFREIGAQASFAVAAKELCDLTTLYPGPRSAKALLQKLLREAGDDGQPVRVSVAVNGTDAQWRKKWNSRYPASPYKELTPVLTAVAKSLETDDPAHWVSAFTKATGVGDIDLPVSELAYQAYIECVQVAVAKRVKA